MLSTWCVGATLWEHAFLGWASWFPILMVYSLDKQQDIFSGQAEVADVLRVLLTDWDFPMCFVEWSSFQNISQLARNWAEPWSHTVYVMAVKEEKVQVQKMVAELLNRNMCRIFFRSFGLEGLLSTMLLSTHPRSTDHQLGAAQWPQEYWYLSCSDVANGSFGACPGRCDARDVTVLWCLICLGHVEICSVIMCNSASFWGVTCSFGALPLCGISQNLEVSFGFWSVKVVFTSS